MTHHYYFFCSCRYVLCCEMFKQVISITCAVNNCSFNSTSLHFSLLKLTIKKKCWSHNWETAKCKVFCLRDVSVLQNLLAVTKARKSRLLHLTLPNFVCAENFNILNRIFFSVKSWHVFSLLFLGLNYVTLLPYDSLRLVRIYFFFF